MIRLSALLLLAAFIACLGGCIGVQNPPVSYYVLASPPEPATTSAISSASKSPRIGPRVGILPVSLPGYLQRQQLVVRQSGSVDIKMEDFHRWGEELGIGIARVISAAMTSSLATVGGVAIPLRTGAPVDARIQLEIRRFEGVPGGEVTLEAFWTLLKDGTPLREGYFLQQSHADNSLASVVQQQSALLGTLGAAMAVSVADAIK